MTPLDESFAALDALTRDKLALDFGSLWLAKHKTVLLITHNISEAIFLATVSSSCRRARVASTWTSPLHWNVRVRSRFRKRRSSRGIWRPLASALKHGEFFMAANAARKSSFGDAVTARALPVAAFGSNDP